MEHVITFYTPASCFGIKVKAGGMLTHVCCRRPTGAAAEGQPGQDPV
jgi:hypothetical protein